ncbi:metalloreductase STEAP4 isoform X2 [Cherax quadricarinatus]|uniref:metalloreductase STEAP4 isoform X2 n=1 Tax=Cherax quadricarinatus TaxID=27406 RepID=UPI00387EC4C7
MREQVFPGASQLCEAPVRARTLSILISSSHSSDDMELTEQLVEAGQDHDDQDNEWGDRRVILVGSGDMTRALAPSLLRAHYRPVVATRKPNRARTWMSQEVEVCTLEEGLAQGDLVVVAIPAIHHHTLPKHLFTNKIIVDISNRYPGETQKVSLAEALQEMLPEAQVVKAFNTLSAYVLEREELYCGREVPVCGGTTFARARVMALVRDMGMVPVDKGGLKNARTLEEIPFQFFPEWKVAFIVTGIIFAFFWTIKFFRSQICYNLQKDGDWDWGVFEKLPLSNTQNALAFTGCLLLLLCYIPGMIAAYLQLWRGTKYSRFPGWLDTWLKSRKQLGLLSLLTGCTHGCLAIFLNINWHQAISWTQSIYITCGVLLAAVMTILGVTSLPSVSVKLTWREFSVVQRYLGWISVILLTSHLTFLSILGLMRPLSCYFLLSGPQIMVPVCFLTLMFKIPLVLPCIDSRLTKIRRGYERHNPTDSDNQMPKLIP